jgi:hypothetical protein
MVVNVGNSTSTTVDVFVASGRYSHMALVSGMWESLLALTLHFSFHENLLYIELGLMLGLHTHMEE